MTVSCSWTLEQDTTGSSMEREPPCLQQYSEGPNFSQISNPNMLFGWIRHLFWTFSASNLIDIIFSDLIITPSHCKERQNSWLCPGKMKQKTPKSEFFHSSALYLYSESPCWKDWAGEYVMTIHLCRGSFVKLNFSLNSTFICRLTFEL